MKIQYSATFLLIFLLVICLCSCSSKVVETKSSSPVPSVVATESTSPVPGETDEPVSVSPSPTDTSVKPKVDMAFITSSLEESNFYINNNETITYSGKILLHIYLDSKPEQWIKDYIYINNTLIDPDLVYFGLAEITILLDENQSEFYSITIKDTEPGNERGLREEFSVNFIHHEALAFEISIADSIVSSFPDPPLYLSAPTQSFICTFNKPVDNQTLQFPDIMKDYEIETSWISDKEMILTINNLSIHGYTLAIEYISGKAPEFGNNIQFSGRLLDPMSYDYTYSFRVCKRQQLYQITPETNEVEMLDEFDYGMIFEDASKDLEYLSLGIITNDMEGWSYAKSIYNLKTGELTPLDSKISASVSQALDAEITTYATGLYNPMVANEFWDNKNNYHYFFGNSIFNIDPIDLSAEIYFSDYETSRYPYPVFHLDNGDTAVIRQRASSLINELRIISDNAESNPVYNLPFKTKTGEGWIQYLVHMADAGDNRLLVSGYEFNEGEENLISTYLLNLEDASMTLVTKANQLIDYFEQPGYILYSNYDPELKTHKIYFISIDGQTLHTLVPEENTFWDDFIYNADTNVFYIKKYSEVSGNYTILILNADTFEIMESDLIFEQDVRLIGVTPEGKLLAIDMP